MSEFCRVVERTKYTARERRSKPQPWVVRKLMVVVTLALLIYAFYVYVGRFCTPIIQKKAGHRFAERGTAVALMVLFCILWLWAMWAYIKLILTPPGYAKDHVPKSPRPLMATQFAPQGNSIPVPLAEEGEGEPRSRTTLAGPSYEELSRRDQPPPSQKRPSIDLEKKAAPARPVASSQEHASGELHHPQEPRPQVPTNVSIAYARGPPTTPVLLPEHRYCQRDELVKPYRAHHCRQCGTCVLRFDHHCPWIGQCVGARNHKFFINFNFAALLFTAYTFATLLAFNVHAVNTVDGDFDPQSIAIVALSALFTIFTFTLLVSHLRLALIGQSTVENLEIQNLKERVKYGTFVREDAGCLARPDTNALREFEKEWGAPDREGYIWWMGSSRKAWEDVMGDKWIGWFLPVGRPLGDGVSYPVNPRFDAEGRWRKRSDWPS